MKIIKKQLRMLKRPIKGLNPKNAEEFLKNIRWRLGIRLIELQNMIGYDVPVTYIYNDKGIPTKAFYEGTREEVSKDSAIRPEWKLYNCEVGGRGKTHSEAPANLFFEIAGACFEQIYRRMALPEEMRLEANPSLRANLSESYPGQSVMDYFKFDDDPLAEFDSMVPFDFDEVAEDEEEPSPEDEIIETIMYRLREIKSSKMRMKLMTLFMMFVYGAE